MHPKRFVSVLDYHDYYSRKVEINLYLDQLVYRTPVLAKNHIIIGLIFIILNSAIMFFIWNGPVTAIIQNIRANNTPVTEAVVKYVEPKPIFEGHSEAYKGITVYVYDLQCEFTVNEITYTAAVNDYKNIIEPGATVPIHYNPDNPFDNFFVPETPDSPDSFFTFPMALISVICIGFIISFVRFTIWGRFQTEKKYFYNHGKLAKPKPHNYDADKQLAEEGLLNNNNSNSNTYDTYNSYSGYDNNDPFYQGGSFSPAPAYGADDDEFDYGNRYAAEDTDYNSPDQKD